MKLFNTLGIVISAILGFISFFASSNVFIGAGVLVASLLFFFLVAYKKIQNHIQNVSKIHECYLFINNFLITLSIKESLNASLEATANSISDEFKEYMVSISDLNPQEKLLYLEKYYPFHIYRLFTDVVFLWLEEGGKILDMSSHITNEMRQIEEYVAYSQSISKRKTVEIGTLWLFSLAIIVVLRVVLTDTFLGLLKSPIYLISIPLLMGVFLLSLYLLILRVSKLEIRRIDNVK